ncbi:MAG: hypothetical protein HN590_03945 [Calditrichaeota bacterium]|jgi:chemotaxis protein methyltransferase CheR|nr:hypothetical protein [Deltaproteobacteria bacterium]MBT4638272.1 hypothetical protein [Deltaproteobacteria bacterium]MBT6615571.1 hypothetical protein [Deltaproteobacteria bacterium]MBT7616418.1 hypothetical protein [Calditrichota bacterium]MBT7714599.1 hypothetical protein [Deltaproteobacteria bacterium]
MELSLDEFLLFKQYIHKICGLEITIDKKYLIAQRLEKLVIKANCNSYHEYYRKIQYDTFSEEAIINEITTNETSFFRDDHPFDGFNNFILPEIHKLIDQRKNQVGFTESKSADIWCAASSTGEEPYSLAIQIYEYISKETTRHTCRNVKKGPEVICRPIHLNFRCRVN